MIAKSSKRLILSGVLLIVAAVLSMFWSYEFVAQLPAVAAALVVAYYCFFAPNSKTAYIAGFGIYALSGIFEPLVYLYDLYDALIIAGVPLYEVNELVLQDICLQYVLPGIVRFIACGFLVVIKFRWDKKIRTAGTVAFILYIVISRLQYGGLGIMQGLALFNFWVLEGGTVIGNTTPKPVQQEKPAAAKPGTATEQIVLENELASLKQQYENQTITEEEYNRRRKELISKF